MCQVELVLCWTDIMLICAPFPENNNVLSRPDLLFTFIHIIDDLAGYYSKGQKCHLAHYCFNPSIIRAKWHNPSTKCSGHVVNLSTIYIINT